MTPTVRFPACYEPHPFLVPACIAAATLVTTSVMQSFFKDAGDVLERDARGRVATEFALEYRSKDIWPRWFISISETLLPKASRVVLTLGSALATTWGWTCYPNPAYAAVITVIATAFNVVGYTIWSTYEHEMATSVLSLITLAVQLAESAVFIRFRNSYALFVTLVAVQIVLCAFFALHVPLAGWIYKLKSDTKRGTAAWWERERLTLFEWLNVGVFVVTTCLV